MRFYENARSTGQTGASARATAVLARAVATQAAVDGFMVIGFAAIGVLPLTLSLRAPPGLPVRASIRSLWRMRNWWLGFDD